VHESKAIGADLILLIAACLSPDQVRQFADLARSIGLETLLEIHNKEELSHICDEVDLIGVNNRDLKTFSVDINQSIEMASMVPKGKLLIAESGINDIEHIRNLKNHGFSGFLIGEHFMKEPDPAIAFARFVNQLNKDPYAGKSLRHDATRSGQETG
jgi:indole-3-glycerol phosphate synthase